MHCLAKKKPKNFNKYKILLLQGTCKINNSYTSFLEMRKPCLNSGIEQMSSSCFVSLVHQSFGERKPYETYFFEQSVNVFLSWNNCTEF